MQRTYATPGKDWQGFRPVSYSVRKAWDLTLTQISGEGEKRQETATTVGNVLSSLAKKQIQKIESALETEITTPEGIIILKGPSFNRKMVEVLLDLEREGINQFETEWFWYDKDYCTEDAQEVYSFFAVCRDTIVREKVNFFDHSQSGFDPSVFESFEDFQPIWANEREWDEARVRYLYRQFYSETRTGQLMVLRPDRPELFHFERSQDRELSSELMLVTIVRSYHFLWILAPLLAAIAFPSVREYMAIAAGAFAADLLLVCWRTRKVGVRE